MPRRCPCSWRRLLWTAFFLCAGVAYLATSPFLWQLEDLFRLNPLVELRLLFRSLHALQGHCLQQHLEGALPTVVVSLSTLPSRLPYIHRVLKSLLTQSVCPRAIHIWIPRYNTRLRAEYVIPTWLMELSVLHNHPNETAATYDYDADNYLFSSSRIIHIHRILTDYGPASKIIPMLFYLQHLRTRNQSDHQSEMRHPAEAVGGGRHGRFQVDGEQLIMVVDDDVIYSSRLMEQYLCYSRFLPDSVLTTQGRAYYVPWSSLNRFLAAEFTHPQPVDLIYGTSSFLLKPRFIRNLRALVDYSVLDRYAPSSDAERVHFAAKYEDDWFMAFSFMFERIPRVAIPIDHPQLTQLDTVVIVTRGSLTSTINSREQDPEGGGRSNAILLSQAYVQMAISERIPHTVVPAEFNATFLALQCPIRPLSNHCNDMHHICE